MFYVFVSSLLFSLHFSSNVNIPRASYDITVDVSMRSAFYNVSSGAIVLLYICSLCWGVDGNS